MEGKDNNGAPYIATDVKGTATFCKYIHVLYNIDPFFAWPISKFIEPIYSQTEILEKKMLEILVIRDQSPWYT